MRYLFAWVLSFVLMSPAMAGVELASNISANVAVVTSFDTNTGLYAYRYTITNYGESSKNLHEFHIPLRGASILNVQAPAGWESYLKFDQTSIGWCACAEEGVTIPAGYVDDGRALPSSFAVPPGGTLSGFSFQSAYPPSPGSFYAGAWVPIPIEGVDFPEGQEPDIADFPLNLLQGSVNGPLKDDTLYMGGRRPGVDAFLVFANFKDGGSYTSPVIVDILFGPNGESVNQSTFIAKLNGTDVTSQFLILEPNRRRAVFQATNGSPLLVGKNVLLTAVDGVVPGGTQTAKDSDRVVFLAQ
jgi:hypothetical protein